MNKQKLFSKEGVSLIEILLTVSLIALIAGFSAVVYYNFLLRSDSSVASDTIVGTLKRAQVLSRTAQDDSKWGVYVSGNTVTIFQGESYVSRNTTKDEDYFLPGSVIISGINEIVFEKVTGNPNLTGTITISAKNGQTKDITISAKGVLNY